MCLAIPGLVIESFEEQGLTMGRINYAGTVHTACLHYVPEARPGDYVLVHAGFALNVLDPVEAAESLAAWDELVRLAAEEGNDIFGMPLTPDTEGPDPGSNGNSRGSTEGGPT